MRLGLAAPWRRWPVWLLAVAWVVSLALVPWWVGLPLLLALAAVKLANAPRLQPYSRLIRHTLRFGFMGVLIASYRAFGGHALGLTFTLLAALVGFSLLVLLESWQDRKPLRDTVIAAGSPEWKDLAMAPVGPTAVIIDVQPPVWVTLDDAVSNMAVDVQRVAEHTYRVGAGSTISPVEAHMSLSAAQGWIAWSMTAKRGVVLYDRAHDKPFRLRGWQLFGWHGEEAWLTRDDDQMPLALSHVLGQDQFEE